MPLADIIQFLPREVYHRTPPVSFGSMDPFVPFRTMEQETGPVFLLQFNEVRLAAHVSGVHEYCAILDQSCKTVFHPEPFPSAAGKIVTNKPYLNGVRLSMKRFNPPVTSFDRALLLNFPLNYGHWISDAFPVFDVLENFPDLRNDPPDVLISGSISGTLRNRFTEFVTELGIPAGKIFFLADFLDYKQLRRRLLSRLSLLYSQQNCTVNSLFVVTGHVRHPHSKYARLRTFYHSFIHDKLGRREPVKSRTRIFVSRKDASDRFLNNEDEIFHILKNEGFERVLGSQLTCSAAATIFSRAEMVAGVCGASLANIAFAPPDCDFINILPENMPGIWYWDLANLLGLSYCEVRGEMKENQRKTGMKMRNSENFSVSPDLVRQAYGHMTGRHKQRCSH